MRAIQRLHCLDDLTASTVSRASPTPGSLIREVMASSSTNAEKIAGSLNIGAANGDDGWNSTFFKVAKLRGAHMARLAAIVVAPRWSRAAIRRGN